MCDPNLKTNSGTGLPTTTHKHTILRFPRTKKIGKQGCGSRSGQPGSAASTFVDRVACYEMTSFWKRKRRRRKHRFRIPWCEAWSAAQVSDKCCEWMRSLSMRSSKCVLMLLLIVNCNCKTSHWDWDDLLSLGPKDQLRWFPSSAKEAAFLVVRVFWST